MGLERFVGAFHVKQSVSNIFHCGQFQVVKIRGRRGFVTHQCRLCGRKFERAKRNGREENERRLISDAIDKEKLDVLRKILKG